MLHGKRLWYDSFMLIQNIKAGDLVRVVKGYVIQPSPQTGDVGIALHTCMPWGNDWMVLINGEQWRQSEQDLEVIDGTSDHDNVSTNVCDDVHAASVSSEHQNIQE